jgi:hypothetical protein
LTVVESETAAQEFAQESLGFVQLRSGTTHPLMRRGRTVEQAGVIYTDVADMPSLQDLLTQREVALAVLEVPVVVAARPAANAAVGSAEATSPDVGYLAWRRLAIATAIATAVCAIGWTLFAVSVSGSLRVNAYAALALGLGGFVLLATVWAAMNEGDGSR